MSLKVRKKDISSHGPEGRLFNGWTLNGLPLVNGIIDSQLLKGAGIIPESELLVNAAWGFLITVEPPRVGKITVTAEGQSRRRLIPNTI